MTLKTRRNSSDLRIPLAFRPAKDSLTMPCNGYLHRICTNGIVNQLICGPYSGPRNESDSMSEFFNGSSTDKKAAWMLSKWFLLSLVLPVHFAFEPPYQIDWGISYFLVGAMTFPFIPMWWANPLFFGGLYCLTKGKYQQAMYLGSAASLSALSTFSLVIERYWRLQTFDGTFGPAFYIWVGCMVGLTVISGNEYRKTARSRTWYGKLHLDDQWNLPAVQSGSQTEQNVQSSIGES